jgi:hypothetical protein
MCKSLERNGFNSLEGLVFNHKEHQILQETNLVFIILLELVNKKKPRNGKWHYLCPFFGWLMGHWLHLQGIFKVGYYDKFQHFMGVIPFHLW